VLGKRRTERVLTINTCAIQEGGASDPYLLEDDVLPVHRNGTKRVLLEVWDFF
jgi:hypothetical protein